MLSSVFVVVFVLVVVLLLGCVGQERPTLKLNSGLVKGHHKQSSAGRTIAAFEGIPYAKPPIGELRFAEPQPSEPWSGTWEATNLYTCVQQGWLVNGLVGSEDCLYINVYVPREKPIPNENLDVMVHIHGGGFMIGSGEICGPETLIDRDVVYVNFNYRLGPLGFLSTEDDVIPGNNGMKDQVLALKWVQENIAQFGGNPGSVTITGLSAGGASVHLHYFSPLSKGLFHRGISQSGIATCPWAIQKSPLRRTKKLAAVVGCDHVNTEELVKCLRQRPAHQIIDSIKKLHVLPMLPIAMFGPTVEEKSGTAFLTDHPFKLLSTGNVQDLPWISSIATHEGLALLTLVRQMFDKVENEWDELAPQLLEYDVTVPKTEQSSVSQKIKQFYFGNEKISPERAPQIIKLFGDRYFTLDLEKCARMQSKVNKAPVYSYIYGYKSSIGTAVDKKMFNIDSYMGVNHGEDSYLLYNLTFNNVQFVTETLTQADMDVKELLLNIFTSFAKNGNPDLEGIRWDQVLNAGDFGYLSIKGPEDAEMVFEKEIAPTEFWESLSINDNDKVKYKKDEL